MPKINIGNTKLFFDIYGSKLDIQKTVVKEKPTMIVLHGGHGMVDHTLYVEFWSQFSDIAQVIFLDQRGCGRSDVTEKNEWNLAHWGQDIVDFCDALSIEKPIVAGVSMGGHVMCEYATKYPEHPGALIFCNTEARFDVHAVIKKFEELGGSEIANIARENFLSPSPEIAKIYEERCIPFYAKNAYSKDEIKRCRQRREVFEHFCRNEFNTFNYLDEIHKICCQTLFMVGEDSPGHPPQFAQEMADRIDKKRVTYHLFKNAGAAVYKDVPVESYQVVKDFLMLISESKTCKKAN